MQVPAGLYWASAFFQRSQALWLTLAKLETALLKDELASVTLQAPVYITGVARSGSTILLEMLNRHPALSSHRYSDFPNIYTPYWRNWLLQRARFTRQQAQERTHQDRIQITQDSPEAMEEVLWMAFFPACHALDSSQVLDAATRNPAFESFYRDHIRKLLLIRRRPRYVAKGNYNLTRLPYIQQLFPDARFIIPVREPVRHIASLMKQDRLFNAGLRNNPRARRYLAWAGHFEFGPDKRPIHTGDAALVQAIIRSWQEGDSVRAWALYWNALYQTALAQIEADERLQAACLILRYEDLCNDSGASIERILQHCRLDETGFEHARAYYQHYLTEPDYYQVTFNQSERGTIAEICGATAARLGYTSL